ncbi:MAG: biotin transporter BioY [Clostridia bacterium]|nr:biotin transporter BioY [Clostridia bacterium]
MARFSKTSALSVVRIALFAAIISVTAFVSVPFPVPLTLQTLGIFTALFTLGARRGAASVLLYVAIGAVGLPVFSGFTGGVGRLFDLTGGFIFGFLLAAVVYIPLARFAKGAFGYITVGSICQLVIYASGVLGYVIVSGVSGASVGVGSAILTCVLPYIIPDFIKIFISYVISKRLRSIMKKESRHEIN